MAWLIFDAGGDLFEYQCYWMDGPSGDHLIESARVATDIDAVNWAAARTPRARIRLRDHRTYWAGTGPVQDGFAGIWAAPAPAVDTNLAPLLSPSGRVSVPAAA